MMFRWDPHRPGLNSVWNVTTFFETRLHLGLMNECFRDSSSYKVDFVWEGINCAHSSDSSISLVLFRFRGFEFCLCNNKFRILVGSDFPWTLCFLLLLSVSCENIANSNMKNGMRLILILIKMWNQIVQSISK